jgi:hypothetical protein
MRQALCVWPFSDWRDQNGKKKSHHPGYFADEKRGEEDYEGKPARLSYGGFG